MPVPFRASPCLVMSVALALMGSAAPVPSLGHIRVGVQHTSVSALHGFPPGEAYE